MSRNREIESKWLVKDTTLEVVRKELEEILGDTVVKSVLGTSTDTYWIPGPDAEAQFVRLRERDDDVRQITVKARDKDSNINRLEVDVNAISEKTTIKRLLNALFSKAAGTVTKQYRVYWSTPDHRTNVSAYTVLEDVGPYPHTFIECETISIEKLTEMDEQIIPALQARGFKVDRASGSLFELFITKEKV